MDSVPTDEVSPAMSAAALLVSELVESDAPTGFVYLDGATGRLALDCGPLTPCEVLGLLVETGSKPGDRWSAPFTAAAVVARGSVHDLDADIHSACQLYLAHACDGSWHTRVVSDDGGYTIDAPPTGGALAAALAAVVTVDSDTLSTWKGDTA